MIVCGLPAPTGITIRELIGSRLQWSAEDLASELTATPRDLLLLGVHANHYDHGTASGGEWLRALERIMRRG